jgi:cytochrome c oxidase assembly protein subunit 15
MPPAHNTFVDLNFTHTRVGAGFVALLLIALALRTVGNAGGEVRLIRPAALVVALVAVQITLGAYVVWNGRPPLLTTAHVVNGAALLATTVLLAVRAGRATRREPDAPTAPATFEEVAA